MFFGPVDALEWEWHACFNQLQRGAIGVEMLRSRNERLIMILYYYEELTMKEIGSTLGLSESRVSQMHSSIVARLKDQLRRRRPEFA